MCTSLWLLSVLSRLWKCLKLINIIEKHCVHLQRKPNAMFFFSIESDMKVCLFQREYITSFQATMGLEILIMRLSSFEI